MKPHEERVIQEREELYTRLWKLQAFFGTPTFAHLPNDEQARLTRQRDIMRQYVDILQERIDHF